jgi:hypothetical protein
LARHAERRSGRHSGGRHADIGSGRSSDRHDGSHSRHHSHTDHNPRGNADPSHDAHGSGGRSCSTSGDLVSINAEASGPDRCAEAGRAGHEGGGRELPFVLPRLLHSAAARGPELQQRRDRRSEELHGAAAGPASRRRGP